MPRPLVPNVYQIEVNHYEREVKEAIGRAHDYAFSDPDKALRWIDAAVAYCTELQAVVKKVAAEEADMRERYDRQVSTPVPGGGW